MDSVRLTEDPDNLGLELLVGDDPDEGLHDDVGRALTVVVVHPEVVVGQDRVVLVHILQGLLDDCAGGELNVVSVWNTSKWQDDFTYFHSFKALPKGCSKLQNPKPRLISSAWRET